MYFLLPPPPWLRFYLQFQGPSPGEHLMRLCSLPRSKRSYYRLCLFQRCHFHLVAILGQIAWPCLGDRCQRTAVHRRLVETEIRNRTIVFISRSVRTIARVSISLTYRWFYLDSELEPRRMVKRGSLEATRMPAYSSRDRSIEEGNVEMHG